MQITGASRHAVQRARRRGISTASILDACQRPLRTIAEGDRREYVGRVCTVVISTDGTVITVYESRG